MPFLHPSNIARSLLFWRYFFDAGLSRSMNERISKNDEEQRLELSIMSSLNVKRIFSSALENIENRRAQNLWVVVALIMIGYLSEGRSSFNIRFLRCPAKGFVGFRIKIIMNNHQEECTFSIIYGDEYDCLDLVADSADDANIWVTGLIALTTNRCEDERLLIWFFPSYSSCNWTQSFISPFALSLKHIHRNSNLHHFSGKADHVFTGYAQRKVCIHLYLPHKIWDEKITSICHLESKLIINNASRWLESVFDEEDRGRRGEIGEKEAVRAIASINRRLPTQRIKMKFKASQMDEIIEKNVCFCRKWANLRRKTSRFDWSIRRTLSSCTRNWLRGQR